MMISQTTFSWYPKYAVDVVLCIDGKLPAESHEKQDKNLLDCVKTMARRIVKDIYHEMESKGKQIETFRVRTIVFREYMADGEHAMLATDFYLLPQETMGFEIVLSNIDSVGKVTACNDGLEALAYAIKSKWNTDNKHRRQVIIVWSDKETNKLGAGKGLINYPQGMAKSLEELQEWWSTMGESKRLVLFTPNSSTWKCVSNSWDYVLHYPSRAGESMPYTIYDEIVRCIVKDV